MRLRRTIATVAVFTLFASLAFAQRTDKVPQADKDAMRSYTLTMPKVQAFYAASKDLDQLGKKDPAFRQQTKSIDIEVSGSAMESARRIDATPKAAAILKAHGLTGKDFVLIPMSIMTAGVNDMLQQHGKPGIDYLNPANLTFYRQHKQELKALEKQNMPSDDDDQ